MVIPDPGTGQRWLRQELPAKLVEAGFRLAQPGAGARDRIVLGVADYSRDDLLLLDSIHANPSVRARVEAFLLMACRSQADIEALIPSIGPVFQNPVVGIWEAGALAECGSGHVARSLLQGLLRDRTGP